MVYEHSLNIVDRTLSTYWEDLQPVLQLEYSHDHENVVEEEDEFLDLELGYSVYVS